MPKLSERHEPTVQARLDIQQAVIRAVRQHALTFAELFSILSGIMQDWAKHAAREERETARRG